MADVKAHGTVFSDIGIRFITENRGLLQQYRLEHLTERVKLILGEQHEDKARQVFGTVKATIAHVLNGDIDSVSSGEVCEAIIEALVGIDVPGVEIEQRYANHECLAIAVLVVLDTGNFSSNIGNADQNVTTLNLAEQLCQAACFSYMEHLFPGRYTDLERLAELAMLTGFGVFTQAFDGQIPDAFKPLMKSVLLQPGYLDHAKAALAEVKTFGKRETASAGGRGRAEVREPYKQFAIARYMEDSEEWSTPKEASMAIFWEMNRHFGSGTIAGHKITDDTVYKWILPHSHRRAAPK